MKLYNGTFSPNALRVRAVIFELGLDPEIVEVNLQKGENRTPDYLKLNPNGRIPVIVDPDGPNGELVLFESGAILMYLAEKTGRLLPNDPVARLLAIQWLMFQMGGVGPMMGQANVFFRYLPEKIPTAIARYQNECRRLFEVLDTRLAEAEWLAGSEYSIADIANWCWVRTYKWSGASIDGLPHLRRWLDAMKQRPACQKGITVPVELSNPGDDANKDEAFANAARTLVQR